MDADTVEKAKKPKLRVSKGQIILLALLGVLLALVITVVVFIASKPTFINGIVTDILLVRLAKDKEIECEVDADIKYGTFEAETEARFWRTELEDELMATMVEIGNMKLYFIDGALYLENGRGFKTEGKGNADYSAAISSLPDLLDGYTVNSRKTNDGREYYVVVTGDGAVDYVTDLYPDYADKISEVEDIEINLLVEDWKITRIRLAGSAILDNGNEAELDAVIKVIDDADRSEHEIPQAVLDAMGDDVENLTISQDMIDLAYAISRYYSKDPNAAQISLATNVTFFELGYDNVNWYRLKVEDEWINYVSVANKKYYYNGNGSCNADGSNLNEAEKAPIDIAKVVDSVYDIFLERKFSATEEDGTTLYQVELDKEDVSNLVATYLPKFLTYADKVESAEATLTVVEGQVTEVKLVLHGSVKILFLQKAFDVWLTFTPETDIDSVEFDVPDEVVEALIGK